jgi:predicted dehydrogenase
MQTLGIVLVGAGNIAQNIHLPVLAAMAGVRLIAIVDKQLSKARILADRYGIPNVARTVDDVLGLPGVDAVVVTTSTDAHASVTLAAIAAGKHVFVERPIARTLDETMAIRTAAAEADVTVMVGMNHRFRPDVVQLKNAVERGDIGSVFYVKAGWVKQRSTDARWLAQADKSGGGVLVDLGIVVLDMILHVFNFGRVRSVTCSTFHHETKSVEDVVVAMLTFDSGAVATIETSWSLMRAEDLYYCNVFGKKGSAFINPFKLVKRVGNEFQTTMPTAQKAQLSIYRKTYETELKHFMNSAKGLVPPVSTVDEAVDRMKVVEALYASAELKREIVIP